MVIRKSFEKELDLLQQKILDMGHLAERALRTSISSLKRQDLQLAEQVIMGDAAINNLEEEIEELVVWIITAQQPVAGDLRNIMSVLKISTSIERIGDFAVDIANVTKRIGAEKLIKPLHDLPVMAKMVQTMIREVLHAYVEENVELAQDIAAMDDQVDRLYSKIVTDLQQKAVDDPRRLEHVMLLAFVARYIERTADYVTNIAEGILYSVKGKRADLNQ